jgi:hypothetical protein
MVLVDAVTVHEELIEETKDLVLYPSLLDASDALVFSLTRWRFVRQLLPLPRTEES